MAKYTLVAYLLWLPLGWMGVHHFYLGRDRQGLLWLTSFAGLFGIGWLRDFWRLPTYVKDANDDPKFMGILILETENQKGPGIFRNWHRLVAQVLFGAFYRGLIYCAIPWESSVTSYAALILVPLGTAFGTYMVSNVGRQKSPPHYSLLGAYIGEFLMGEPHLLLEESNSFYAAGVAMAISTYGWEWRRQDGNTPCNNNEKQKPATTETERDTNTPSQEKEKTHKYSTPLQETPLCKNRKTRIIVMLMIYGVFIVLCGCFIYFNATVETEDGETIKVRDAIDNFLNSPAWQQIKSALWVLLVDIYESWKTGGYEEAWNKFKYLADIEGEDHAYVELGLEPGTPFKEVRKRYKELAKEWHPDHHHGEEKLKAQEIFMRYNDAYKILEKIHKRRKRSDED